jgi:serine/threonine-protein kinase
MARTLQEGLRARPRVQRKRLIAGAIACLLFGVVAAFMLKPSEGRPLEAAQPGSVPSALEHAADDSIEMARAEAEEAASAAELGPGLGAGAATDGVGEGAVAAPSPASAEVVELAELPVEVAEPPVEATKASPKPAPRRATVRRKPVARATSNCNPPYTVDARGIRHLKLECVQ